MYNLQVLLNIQKTSLSFEDYLVLKIIEDKAMYEFNIAKLETSINFLKINQYITWDGKLTDKGIKMISEIEKKKTTTNYDSIFLSLQNELQKLTGSKQKTDKISGKSYSFMPNCQDFNSRLGKVISKYKLKDLSKVEKTLLLYIRKCHKAQNWFPTLTYYIEKEGISRLATDYENYTENTTLINKEEGNNANFEL